MKPKTLSIEIDRVEGVGPVGIGISAILVAEEGHLASVVLSLMCEGPEEARKFQSWVVEVIKAQAAATEKKILDPSGNPAQEKLIH